MLDALKEHLHLLKTAEPGKRFEAYFEQSHDSGGSRFLRIFILIAGVLLVLVGLVLMPAPGPGMVVVAAGAALMAGQSRAVARMLDRLEMGARGVWQRWRGKRA